MSGLFIDTAFGLVRTAVIGIFAYAGLVVLLRISGRRTLSKMNAFDFVVTVALGSTLATILLNSDVALAEGLLAFAVLIGLQFLITWSSVRVSWVRKLVTGEPILLVFRGEMLGDAMRSARVTGDEVRAAVRSAGLSAIQDADAVVLETDGSFSVMRESGSGFSTLTHVRSPPEIA
jgi:uncharacterized membrane protein YcaP (DUF421 family)